MVKIYVEHCDENLTEYDVDLAVSVGRLKDEIEEIEGHSRRKQCLTFERRELQDNQSLFSSSIREHSIVQLSVTVDAEEEWLPLGEPAYSRRRPGTLAEVEPHLALYDWDGDMKHPKTNGVPFRKGMRVDVDVIATKHDASGNKNIWCLGYCEENYGPFGWIPRSYIRSESASEPQYIWSESARTSDSEVAPSLPAFTFLSAIPIEYKLHLGEKGHSYVKATLTYEACAPPGQPTLVNVQLECVGTSDRCISSVSLKITSPDQTVKDVKSPEANRFGAQKPVHVEVTKRQTTEHHGELHFAAAQIPFGADAGASRQNEQTQSESGTRQSQIQIKGSVYSKDTAHWAVDGARGVGERDCVPNELQGMSFVLEEKPAVFLYECYVTTVKNGQRKEHSGGSKGLFRQLTVKNGKRKEHSGGSKGLFGKHWWKGKGRFGF
ncbi:hypothetical protein K438DRAFT_1846681 [Mycena galopus ATCC 62051]|nr:hypothetical protein K438DRAFT_1846681 [Mycena galopus ATCC 62051]